MNNGFAGFVQHFNAADVPAQRRATRTAAAKAPNRSVLVSKQDRLSRDVAFVSGLMAQRVQFIVAELGRELIRSCCTSMPRWPRNGG